MARTKVFCVGFQKTGTTSIDKALTTFGYRVASWFGDDLTLGEVRHGYVQMGLKIAAQHDAAQDMPWPLMFRELDEAFPGSKFVLTVRDVDSWYKSICAHFGTNCGSVQQLTYGEDAGAPVGNEARYKQVYQAHNQAVRDYFKDRPNDLLVMDLQAGDGWDKLCPFIGEPIPDQPFFHANASTVRRTLLYRVARRLRMLGLPVSEVGR